MPASLQRDIAEQMGKLLPEGPQKPDQWLGYREGEGGRKENKREENKITSQESLPI